MTVGAPLTRTLYPVAGSAFAATSGTPRPRCPPGFAEGGTFAPDWYGGTGKTLLIPPPVVPFDACQTTSLEMLEPLARSVVPPQARACVAEAGNKTCCRPSPTLSADPLSPEAQHTVMPRLAAAAKAPSMLVIACAAHVDSG